VQFSHSGRAFAAGDDLILTIVPRSEVEPSPPLEILGLELDSTTFIIANQLQ